MINKVIATQATIELIRTLKRKHGPRLVFHQPGGGGEPSAALCQLEDEVMIGSADLKLGEIDGLPFYIGAQGYARLGHAQLIIDVVEGGRVQTPSLESPEGKAFRTRPRLFTDNETMALSLAGRL